MHFRGTGLSHHLDDLLGGGAAHDRIVDQDHALAGEARPVGVVLELHAQMADLVGGFDEGTADIVVADDAEIERDAGLLGVAEARRHAAVGNGHYEIGGHTAFARKFRADALARLVDRNTFHDAVGSREINILENAKALSLGPERHQRANARTIEDHHFAGRKIAHVGGADNVERAGLGREDPRIVELAEHKRAHAARIAHGDDRVLGDAGQRIRSLDLVEGRDQARDEIALRLGHQMDDDFGVGRRLEDRATLHEGAAQRIGIREVAVVAQREAAELELGEKRLDVAQDGAAARGVARVADGAVAAQACHDFFVAEIIADQTDRTVRVELRAVEGDNAGRLLAAMLQRVEAEGSECGRVLVAENAENSAFFLELVVVKRIGRDVHTAPKAPAFKQTHKDCGFSGSVRRDGRGQEAVPAPALRRVYSRFRRAV